MVLLGISLFCKALFVIQIIKTKNYYRIAWLIFDLFRIGSLFYKFEWEWSIAGLFKLDTVLQKKLLKLEQSPSSFNMTFPLSVILNFSPFDTFYVKWGKIFSKTTFYG